MKLRLLVGFALIAAVWRLPVSAQATRSIWDGVYTKQQAAQGNAIYKTHCVACHGKTLNGNRFTPPLNGVFLSGWSSLSIKDLFYKIQETMPARRGDASARVTTLKGPETAQVLAYLLQANRVPAGSTELASELSVLERIRIQPRAQKK